MKELEFMSKFKPDTRCIKNFKYWIVCIRAKQRTLGDAVILLKRETSSVKNLTSEEAAEFPEVIKWYEDICTNKFGATKFNYMMMMMKDFYVHYHAFPRYENSVHILNSEWKDADWPLAIDFKSGDILEEEKLMQIKEYMKA